MVYPYSSLGDVLALAVGDAPVVIHINVGPIPLSKITASHRAGWKIYSRKQNEFSWGRHAINVGQEESDTIAVHLKVARGHSDRCWYKQSWEEEHDEAEKDVRS